MPFGAKFKSSDHLRLQVDVPLYPDGPPPEHNTTQKGVEPEATDPDPHAGINRRGCRLGITGLVDRITSDDGAPRQG
jgi:hypothetical protein